jgi:hypothetical protein
MVATIGIISTKSFEERSSEPGNTRIIGSAEDMFVARPNAFRDVRLLGRYNDVALLIYVAAWEIPDVEKANIARLLAAAAFDRVIGRIP